MELSTFIAALLRRWWLVLVPVVVAGVFVVPELLRGLDNQSGGFTVTIRYSAAQTASNLPQRDGDFQDVWLASELTVNALTDWVRSSSFRDEIQKRLPDTNLAGLGIAADNRRSIGQLTLTHLQQADLEAITAAAIAVLQDNAQDYFPQLGGQPAAVTILDTPTIVAAPPPLTNRFAPLLRLGVALLGGIGLAFAVEIMDPMVRRREQVEEAGLYLIGSIPRH